MTSFDSGAIHGLELYCREVARVGVFGTPFLVGWMQACIFGDDFSRGTLHGFALGADLQGRAMSATVFGQ